MLSVCVADGAGMMFDIGWPEMLIVGMIALFVVGPKELPHVLMTLSRYWRKIRGTAMEFRGQFDDLIREAELDEIRKEVGQAGKFDLPERIDLDVTVEAPGAKKRETDPKPIAAPQPESTQSEAAENGKPERE